MMDYDTGKLLERLIDQNNQIIEMLKTIGDMVYAQTPEKAKTKRNSRREVIEDDEEELSEDEKNELEIITAEKEKNQKEIRNLTK